MICLRRSDMTRLKLFKKWKDVSAASCWNQSKSSRFSNSQLLRNFLNLSSSLWPLKVQPTFSLSWVAEATMRLQHKQREIKITTIVKSWRLKKNPTRLSCKWLQKLFLAIPIGMRVSKALSREIFSLETLSMLLKLLLKLAAQQKLYLLQMLEGSNYLRKSRKNTSQIFAKTPMSRFSSKVSCRMILRSWSRAKSFQKTIAGRSPLLTFFLMLRRTTTSINWCKSLEMNF